MAGGHSIQQHFSLLSPLSSCGIECSPRQVTNTTVQATTVETEPEVSIEVQHEPEQEQDEPSLMRTASVASSLRDHWSKTSLINSYSSSSSSSDSLLDRLADYERRRWLDASSAARLRQQITQGSDIDRSRVEEQLNRLKHAHRSKTSSDDASDQSPQPMSILHQGSNRSTRDLHVSWEDQCSEDDDDEQEQVVVPMTKKLILEPADLWTGAACLTESEMQELFVEMCFFARLGFVQPPCCLQCTYRESTKHKKKRSMKLDCRRWVVWRKDAQALLHPHRLDGNIVIVQCQAARRLLQGDRVEGRRWDAEGKQIVATN